MLGSRHNDSLSLELLLTDVKDVSVPLVRAA